MSTERTNNGEEMQQAHDAEKGHDAEERKVGRPTIYSDALADRICQSLAIGNSLRYTCEKDAMPSVSTVCRWLLDSDKKYFQEQYALARTVQYEMLADEIFDIADDGRNDWMQIQRGEEEYEVPNHEHINRSRLRIDTRKWFLSKVLPKKYGDKVTQEVTGPDGSPLNLTVSFVDGKPF